MYPSASLGRHAPAERSAAAPAAAPAVAPSAVKEPSSPRAQPSSPSSQRGERGAGQDQVRRPLAEAEA
eukprot:scaffold142191_cov130-Phaeocystis_antarctica.AAC.3